MRHEACGQLPGPGDFGGDPSAACLGDVHFLDDETDLHSQWPVERIGQHRREFIGLGTIPGRSGDHHGDVVVADVDPDESVVGVGDDPVVDRVLDRRAFEEIAGRRAPVGEQSTQDHHPEGGDARFEGVESFHVPMHAVQRIDEVRESGPGEIRSIKGDKVTPLPVYTQPPGKG